GDVHTGGSISVPVPDGEYFCEKGDGGTPGVVSYQTGTPDFSSGSVSETDWLANTSFSRKKYEYFRQLLGISPDDEDSFDSFADIGDDIVYYSSNGVDINTGAGSFPAGKKAAILVNGNVNINDNISVPDGSFLAFIALGNIEVADSVSQINGVYITDSKFEAGTNETTALECYGTFIANSFEMEGRDLGETNETTPGVKFIYRPDLWLNAPKELLIPSYTWQELAP
ncbi:hypothetical protein KKI19_03780, partial [Patescibacteria group bacterium]|nr:hypothetical protein [Patescibacteria group bacterium]